MKLLNPKRKPAEAPTASLADRIRATCAEAEAYIETKVRELKATPDAALLPISWLDQDLRRRNGGHCSCRVALRLMGKENE
jgi:hypothetical protein